MIDLARVFDASLTDAWLFQDWQSRRESSLVLYHDLSELIALVQASEKDSLSYFPEQSLDYLEERLTSFREGSMQCLMYKDWQQYEALSEEIIASIRKWRKTSRSIASHGLLSGNSTRAREGQVCPGRLSAGASVYL